jgi:autotransporter translocation and assembly factor TamB
MTRLRKIAGWGVRVGVLLAALVALALLVLHTDWGRELVRRRIQSALQANVDGKVSIGALEGSVFSAPRLRNLKITDRAGRVVVATESVDVDVDLVSVISGPVHLRSVHVRTPEIVLARTPDGVWNLARVFAGKPKPPVVGTLPAGGAGGVVIDALSVEGGQIVVEDGARHATIVGIVLHGGVKPGPELVVDSLVGHWQESDRDVTLAGRLHAGGAALRFIGAHVTVGKSHVDAEKLDVGAGGEFSAELYADDLRAFLLDLPPAAAASLRVRVGPAPGHLVIEGEVSGIDRLPHAVTVHADVMQDGERWHGRVDASAPEATIEANGAVVVVGNRLTFDNMQVNASMSGYAAPTWSVAASTLAVKVTGTWPEWVADGDLSAPDVTYAGTPLGPVRAHVRARDEGHSIDLSLHAGRADLPYALDLEARATWSSDLATLCIALGRARTRRLTWHVHGGAEAIWRREGVSTVRGLGLASAAGQLGIEGDLGGKESVLRLHLTSVDFAQLTRGLSIDGLPAAGRATGLVTIAGTLAAPSITMAGTAAGVALVPWARPFDARVNGGLRAGRANVTARLTGGGMTLDATLAARVPDVRRLGLASIDEARVAAEGIGLGELWSALGVHSDLVGRVTKLEAILHGRSVTLTARVEKLRPRSSPNTVDTSLDATLTNGVVNVHLAAGDADVGELELDAAANAPADLLDARAWRALDPAALRSATLTARHVDLAAALLLLGQEATLAGHVDLQVEVPPGGASAVVQVGLAQGCLSRWNACIEAAALSATLDLGAWRSFDDRAVRAARLEVKNVDLARLAPAAKITGRTDLTLLLEPGRPLVLDVTARDVTTMRTKRRLAGHLRAELGEDATRAYLESSLGSEHLVRADGTLAIGRALLRRLPTRARLLAVATHAEAQIDALPVKVLADEVGVPPTLLARLFGTLHVDSTLDGPLGAPVMAAKLELQKARVDTATFKQLTGDLRWHAGQLGAGLHARQSDGGKLDLALTTGQGIATDGRLAASGFRLAVLAPLVRALGGDWLLEADGVLDGNLRASGTAAAPMLKGSIAVKHGRLRLREVLPPLDNVYIGLEASGPHLDLRAGGRSGRGLISLDDGQVDLGGWMPRVASGELRTQDLRVVVAGWPVNAGIATHFEIDHDGAKHHWDISTLIHESSSIELLGTVSQPASFGQLDDVVVVSKTPTKSASATSDTVNWHIESQQGKVVTVTYGDIQADTTVVLDLKIAKARTRIAGAIAVRGGEVLVQGVPYKITEESQLEFYPFTSVPTIQATLQHDYSSVTVKIHIEGPITRARVQLESDPEYTKEQLMAFIMGGNPDLSDPGTTTVSTSAMSALASAAFSELAPFLKKRIVVGIDEVGTDVAPAKRYSFGTWVRSNVFVNVRYRSTVDITENTTEGQLQWHLGRGFIFEVIGGDRAGSGDILWIWRP